MRLEPILAIAACIVFIGGIGYLAWLMEKKRTEAMTAWAQSHGYVFEGPARRLKPEEIEGLVADAVNLRRQWT